MNKGTEQIPAIYLAIFLKKKGSKKEILVKPATTGRNEALNTEVKC